MRSLAMNKDKIESMCRKSGLVPAKRLVIKGVDVFIADGFSSPPHQNFRRFGIGPEEYPMGCYVTLWWCSKKDEHLDVGQPIFFEPFHDPNMDPSFRPKARINAAIKVAASLLDRRRQQPRG